MLALAPVLALALAGCGSGRHNENYLEHSVVNGASYHAGGLGIYDAFISAPATKGGTTKIIFSVYADSAADSTTLASVAAPDLAADPGTLGDSGHRHRDRHPGE